MSDWVDTHPLPGFLDFAVPVEMLRMQGASHEQHAAVVEREREVIAYRGDHIVFKAEETARATASLIRVLAALAYQPGGVDFMGHHWCSDHAACEFAKAEAAAR